MPLFAPRDREAIVKKVAGELTPHFEVAIGSLMDQIEGLVDEAVRGKHREFLGSFRAGLDRLRPPPTALRDPRVGNAWRGLEEMIDRLRREIP
jgi:hypothetical protein